MRYFLIDDPRAEETKRLCEHLDAMDLGAGLDGIYWLPVPAHMLSAVQKEHESQCGPYVMALECEETSLRLELLVRARGPRKNSRSPTKRNALRHDPRPRTASAPFPAGPPVPGCGALLSSQPEDG